MLLDLRLIVDSNPSLSATQSGTQRNPATLLGKSREIAAILWLLLSNRTGESVAVYPAGSRCRPFSPEDALAVRFQTALGEWEAITNR